MQSIPVKYHSTDPPSSIKHVLPIIEIMLTISVSTAIVERGFSHMNNIKSSTRSNLGKDSMNDIMEIQINGPSLEDYCPDSAIAHWYDKSNGKRHVDGHKLSSN